MKLMIDAATYWPDEEAARKKIWLYLKSAKKFGIPESDMRFYGLGAVQYQGMGYMRLNGQVDFLKDHAEDFTHVLHSDAWDVLFIQPFEELRKRYEQMGRPEFLASANLYCGNIGDPQYDLEQDRHLVEGLYDQTTPYRYVGSAMYIAEIPLVVEYLGRMIRDGIERGHEGRNRSDETWAYAEAWKEGWFRPQIDKTCQVFQNDLRDVIVKDGRAFNTYTGTYPCLLHVSGGYTSPETGKDDRVLPWAQQLGIVE